MLVVITYIQCHTVSSFHIHNKQCNILEHIRMLQSKLYLQYYKITVMHKLHFNYSNKEIPSKKL